LAARLILSEEVSRALGEGRPVVALESAVLTHGLPRPRNLEALARMTGALREQGVVPAAVALIDGVVRVGLTEREVEALSGREGAVKVGLAELAVAAAKGLTGGTTVASTLWAARRAGVAVFATGGIGGVHRGAEYSFDVSGDLSALARFGGCVVCSGAKVILDLPKTFELLEALGVCVLGYRTERLPAFTCVDAGLRARHWVESPEAAAEVLRARDELGLAESVVIANPPPLEHALSFRQFEELEEALGEATASAEVSGQMVTPLLLQVLARGTKGASVDANLALLESNAALAGEIAACLAAPAR
jgi:pseudouridylate synthase